MVKRRVRYVDEAIKVDPVMRLWMLRILVPLGGHRQFVCRQAFTIESLVGILGLEHWLDIASDAFDQKSIQQELRKLHRQAERDSNNESLAGCLSKNINLLSRLVGLNETDCRLLEFAISIHSERLLDDAAETLGELSTAKIFYVLSVLLNLPEPDIRHSLSADGVLVRSGLLSVGYDRVSSLRRKLSLLSNTFVDQMVTIEADPISLLRGTVSAVPSGHLSLADYGHFQTALNVLLPFLRQAIANRRQGVNIFLHGAPGTGKSQLVRSIASDLARELFEVSSEDADGDPITGEYRLRAFRTAQSVFAQKQALVVFDEAEDVFNDGDWLFGRKSTAQVRKAWVNRILEENPIPTIWISNSIRGLDPAFIRRFDMIFELPVPPKKQRETILTSTCGDLLDASRISRIAEVDKLAPAVVAKASSVVRLIRDEIGDSNVAEVFELLISNTLKAQGHRPLTKAILNRLPELYDPNFIHTDIDLVSMSKRLVAASSARLCLYGPPGTGKTAYGRWIAEQIGVPLVIRRASDLMSPYVGETEEKIAKAFRDAQAAEAVLQIDEVDSFLLDRRGAGQRWEISSVNEMLTQMESFSGIFIASTNLMAGLDQAALRRFDLKVKFDFLRSDQAWELFCRYCASLGFADPSAELKTRLSRLRWLTPGDFTVVMRQHSFRPVETPSAFILALEGECMMKEGAKRAIGFC